MHDDGAAGRRQCMLTVPPADVTTRIRYSTCSVHEEENEGVVNSVLKACPHFELVPAVVQWPHRGLPITGNSETFDLSHVVRTEPERDHCTGMFEVRLALLLLVLHSGAGAGAVGVGVGVVVSSD